MQIEIDWRSKKVFQCVKSTSLVFGLSQYTFLRFFSNFGLITTNILAFCGFVFGFFLIFQAKNMISHKMSLKNCFLFDHVIPVFTSMRPQKLNEFNFFS